MATSIVMPQMGYDMHEGTVVRWHKKEGDPVARGEVIADIETDKATVEFEAYTDGVLRKIVAQEGVAVPVGQLIAIIAGPAEPLPADLLAGAGAPSPQPSASPLPVGEGPGVRATAPRGEVRASPIARRLALERGIDISLVPGTGPAGRILEADVLAYRAAMPARSAGPAPEPGASAPERADLSRMRQAIARVTADSKRDVPHFYVVADIDMTRAVELRRGLNESVSNGSRVSVNDLVIKACAVALQRHPKFNAFFRGDHLQMNPSVNIGIAIALETGLIVAGVNGCEGKTLLEIAAASRDLIARANAGSLRSEEYSGTTFSISNLGMYDVDSFAAIIYPPHAAVLAVGAVREAPVVRDGQLAVAQVMKATLSVDHRVADGAEAARFLAAVKKLLENPVSLMV